MEIAKACYSVSKLRAAAELETVAERLQYAMYGIN